MSLETKIPIGKTGSACTTVSETNTAKAVGSGSLDVFATPMMLAVMEQAACTCIADALEEGQTSVGTLAFITHDAASLIGAEISASAKVVGVEGRKVSFILSAHDGSRKVGGGTHDRVVVDAERFMGKLRDA